MFSVRNLIDFFLMGPAAPRFSKWYRNQMRGKGAQGLDLEWAEDWMDHRSVSVAKKAKRNDTPYKIKINTNKNTNMALHDIGEIKKTKPLQHQ